MIPVWRDTFYTHNIGIGNVLRYQITGPDIPYQGIAYADPTGVVSVKINDVVKNYLTTTMPDFRTYDNQTVTHANAIGSFALIDTDTLDTLGTYTFCNDYDYTNHTNYIYNGAHPVNGHANDTMWCFHTYLSSSSLKTLVTTGSCTGYTRSYCGQGAIYYQNRAGGYDSFLFEGHTKRTDNFSRTSLLTIYDNTSIEFGQRPYLTVTTPNWEVNTGWLKDSQARNFAWNVFSSSQIWFHDFKDGQVYPVQIDDQEAEYKEYRNGKQMINYTLHLKGAQTYENQL